MFQFRVDQENRAHSMFPQELIPQMFSNIKSLFKLHHDFLLPQLEERMRTWEEDVSRAAHSKIEFAQKKIQANQIFLNSISPVWTMPKVPVSNQAKSQQQKPVGTF